LNKEELKKATLQDDKKATIELPVAYWQIIVQLLDSLCKRRMEEIKELPEVMINQMLLGDKTKVTKMSGPLLARALIIDKLVEEGYMDPEANNLGGFDWLEEGFEKQESKDYN